MDRIFIRNYALFFLALVLCAGALLHTLVSGNFAIDIQDKKVRHTHGVILAAEQLSALVEAMLAAQRGYIITGQQEFMDEYTRLKKDISNRMANISELVEDNPSQASRIAEMREYIIRLAAKLEERTVKFKMLPHITEDFLDDIGSINNMTKSIIELNADVLHEEYELLNQRMLESESQKSIYFNTLFIGVVMAAALLFLLNGFLLRSQRRRTFIEESLKNTEERFKLAVEGTQDGIFDWDLQTGEVFYSRQFFAMLGYDRESCVGTTGEFKELLHPEDAPRVWKYLESYLDGEISDYSQEFRLKNNNGRWIWVQSRAKAIYGRDGSPRRIVGAHTDITFMKERQERLEQEKRAAEEANRAKSDFLAHMSHEIRTPLNAISGISEIFQNRQDNLDERQKKLVSTLHSSTSALKDIITDVLDFSKIESGELELDVDRFSLAELFETIISMMSLRAGEKGISFVFDYEEVKDVIFYGDKIRFRQILINLIGNALKFTEEGGVSIAAYSETREGEPWLRIDVVDTGIGIAADNFDLIFERFKQADPSASRKYGGTGLGLPISRNLAKLMGGTIILSSQPGKGSTFSLLLPDKEGVLDRPEMSRAENHEELDRKIRGALDEDSRILVVEDYEGNIVVVGYVLDDLGCKYDVARNGAEAVELWKKSRYNIILMDIQMPVTDGFTATRKIREIEKEKGMQRTPIIGMTAHALVGDKDKCIAAGMDAYLPKPLVEVDLKQEILRYLNQKQKAA